MSSAIWPDRLIRQPKPAGCGCRWLWDITVFIWYWCSFSGWSGTGLARRHIRPAVRDRSANHRHACREPASAVRPTPRLFSDAGCDCGSNSHGVAVACANQVRSPTPMTTPSPAGRPTRPMQRLRCLWRPPQPTPRHQRLCPLAPAALLLRVCAGLRSLSPTSSAPATSFSAISRMASGWSRQILTWLLRSRT